MSPEKGLLEREYRYRPSLCSLCIESYAHPKYGPTIHETGRNSYDSLVWALLFGSSHMFPSFLGTRSQSTGCESPFYQVRAMGEANKWVLVPRQGA